MDVTSALQGLFGGGDGSGNPAAAPQPAPASYQAQSPSGPAPVSPAVGPGAIAAGAKPSNVLAVLRPNAAAASTPQGDFANSALSGLGAGGDFSNHSKFGALAAGFMAGSKAAQEHQAALAKQAEEHMKALFEIKNKQDTLNLQIQKQQQEAAQAAATLAQQKVRDENTRKYQEGQNSKDGPNHVETLAEHELASFRHFQRLGGGKSFLSPDEKKALQEGMDKWDRENPAPKPSTPVGTPTAKGAPPAGGEDDATPDPATAPTPSPDGSPAPDPNIDPSSGQVPTPPARPQGLGQQPDQNTDPANANPSGLPHGQTATDPKTGQQMIYDASTGQWSPLVPGGAQPSNNPGDNSNPVGP